MENHDMSRTEMCMMLCNMGHKIEELEVCSNDELMHMCKGKMNMTMGNKMNMYKEMMESTRIIKSWKQYEKLHESSNKEVVIEKPLELDLTQVLKSFQRKLKEMERKSESLIKHGKGLNSPSAYASKNKVDLKTVEKEIKDIKSKIKDIESKIADLKK